MTILTAPGNESSVNNEMIFVTQDAKALDPVTYPNYKYVIDVYVDGDLKARLRATPDPVYSLGKFDVSVILRDYVPAYGLKANYANTTETYDINVAYTCKIGEEYGDTLYTNLVTDSERTCYKTYAPRPFLDSDVIGTITDGIASNMPMTMTGYKSEKWKIIPTFSNVTGVFFTYGVIGSDGSLISDEDLPYSGTNNINQFNVGFQKAIANLALDQSDIDDAATVRIDLDGLQYYYINLICSKYTPVTLAWLNPYGAYESQSFGLVSKKQNQVSRKEFAQLPYQVNASGVVGYDSNGVMYGSKKGYASNVKVSLSLTSHLLTDDEYTWLADLFNSPDVYFFSTTLDRWAPCNIADSNYEYRTYKNSRLKPLQFTINFTDEYNSQYL